MSRVIWKEIGGYEGLYKVSSRGEIWSNITNKILKQGDNGCGYFTVELCKDGKHKRMYVHRIVATAFLGEPDGKLHVNHIDECKANNSLSNLEWVTPKENMIYGTRNERIIKNTDYKKITEKFDYVARNKKIDFKAIAKLKWKSIIQADKVGNVLRTWDSISFVEQELGVNRSNIIACCKGRKKSAYGFTWKYKEAM